MSTIRDMRIKAGLSQVELATKLGMKANTLSQWETGARKPDVRVLPEMASVLGCTIDDLFRKDEANGV